jgi:hypothetical protein
MYAANIKNGLNHFIFFLFWAFFNVVRLYFIPNTFAAHVEIVDVTVEPV